MASQGGRTPPGDPRFAPRQRPACKGHHVELRCKARKLALPVGQGGERDDDEVRARAALVAQSGQEGNGLHGLAQPHLDGGAAGRGGAAEGSNLGLGLGEGGG